MTYLKEWLQRLKGQQQELRTSQDIDRGMRLKEHLNHLAHFLSQLNPRNLVSEWIEKQMDRNMKEAINKEVTFDMLDTQTQ